MPDFNAIVTLYEFKEAEAGGLANVDPKAVAEAVAKDMGIPYEHVRAVLSEHWSGAMN